MGYFAYLRNEFKSINTAQVSQIVFRKETDIQNLSMISIKNLEYTENEEKCFD